LYIVRPRLLGVDTAARGAGCTPDIEGNVVFFSEDKPMLVSGLIKVKPNHLALGIEVLFENLMIYDWTLRKGQWPRVN
jgi:hypothetical protein